MLRDAPLLSELPENDWSTQREVQSSGVIDPFMGWTLQRLRYDDLSHASEAGMSLYMQQHSHALSSINAAQETGHWRTQCFCPIRSNVIAQMDCLPCHMMGTVAL